MARPLRIDVAGLTYHVTGRGNGRMAIYLDDGDRSAFLLRLAEVVEDRRIRCVAYCLMDNHYHLVIRTTEANLSRAAQHLNGTYAQWWNRRHEHVGHVFQGRFGAQIIQHDRYLLTACRYVVLNPVRAGMTAGPADWPWSSYRATAGLTPCPAFLDPRPLWGYFHTSSGEGAAGFRRFAGDPQAEPLPSDAIVGDEDFVERLRPVWEGAGREVSPPTRTLGPPLQGLFAGATSRAARRACMVDACAAGYRIGEIAAFLGVDRSTVSRIVRGKRVRS